MSSKIITLICYIVFHATIDIFKAYKSNKNMVDKAVAIATTTDECRGTFHCQESLPTEYKEERHSDYHLSIQP